MIHRIVTCFAAAAAIAVAVTAWSGVAEAAFVKADPQPTLQGGGGNICPPGPLANCSFNGDAALIKLEFKGTTATVDAVNPAFAGLSAANFEFLFTGDKNKGAGSWTFTANGLDIVITGFFAKGGPGGVAYADTAAAFAGVQTAAFDLGGKGLSNMVFFGQLSEVPIPAALPLLGSALIGLGYWRRRRQTA